MKPREPVNGDLFGKPAKPVRDVTPVSLPMRVAAQTDDAWLLVIDGQKGGAKWVPKSRVTRGEGLEENLFTMARFVAAERGWL